MNLKVFYRFVMRLVRMYDFKLEGGGVKGLKRALTNFLV